MKFIFLLSLSTAWLWGVVFGSVRGVVHDPDQHPLSGAEVLLKSASSDYSLKLTTRADGTFEAAAVPAGAYMVTVTQEGFAPATQAIVVASGNVPTLQFQLQIGVVRQTVTVPEQALAVDPEQTTPTTVVSRRQIQMTPGADLSNSLNAITDYVPGAYLTHDQLHLRGGHQVTWAIDGVPIPNTNIASNVGPQIDPKDIDYLEVQRGGYSAAYGDRTYGVFNVIPRTGFERSREGELVTTFGTLHETNDQVNFGDHTEKFAYFASINANRSDYGLETPGPRVLHDRVWGVGGMGSFIYNHGANDQVRAVASLRRDDYQIPNDPEAEAAGIRDTERERDVLTNISWVHTFKPGVLLTVSPYYHYNRADYDGGPQDYPISTTQQRQSQYAGIQIATNAVTHRHNVSAGIYQFGELEHESVKLLPNDGSAVPLFQSQRINGHLEAVFLEDQFRGLSWLTLVAGARLTHFSGRLAENAASPRLGGSIRIPRLHWVLHGFWGRYYQAPPLSTVEGPVLALAVSQGLGFIPLHGERDEEHQFGLSIPLKGWALEVNDYHMRARNYFDHIAIGTSNIFFPVTIQNARLYGWEVSIRSPQLFRRGEVYAGYAYAHAEGAGALNGGLTDFSAPSNGYFLLDHDQRHTLHAGFNFSLPRRFVLGANLYYGSGFTDGSTEGVPAHLPGHTTVDFSLSKSFGENLTFGVTALNLGNRRFLLDNSPTFGGTHYADPRRIYGQVRYRFRF